MHVTVFDMSPEHDGDGQNEIQLQINQENLSQRVILSSAWKRACEWGQGTRDRGGEQEVWRNGSVFDLLLVQVCPTFFRLSTYTNPL